MEKRRKAESISANCNSLVCVSGTLMINRMPYRNLKTIWLDEGRKHFTLSRELAVASELISPKLVASSEK